MSRKSYVISVDSSSSAVEACLVDSSNGEVVKRFSIPITLYTPHEDWFEYDAEEIWNKQLEVIVKIRDWAVKKSLTILGIGISNQRETIVAWDRKTLKPICRAISWQDSRNKEFLNRFSHAKDEIKKRTGLYLSEYFSASKMVWILDHVPCNRDDIRFGTIDSWLLINLTKGTIYFTDVTNASRTMCMNLQEENWDKELLDLFHIPLSSLPQIRPSGSCFGFWEGIPIWGVIGDQQAALLTLGKNEGAVQCTYGTGLFLLRNCGSNLCFMDEAVTTVAWKIRGESTIYAMESGSFSCGRILDQLQKKHYFYSYKVGRYRVPMSVYVEPVGKRLFLFEKSMEKTISLNFDLYRQRGPIVLKSFLNGLVLIVKEIVRWFELANYPIVEFQMGGQISNIDYLKQTQAIALWKNVFSSCGGDHTVIGTALLVLLTLKKVSWEDINRFSSASRSFFKPSPIHVSEKIGLDNLHLRLKNYL